MTGSSMQYTIFITVNDTTKNEDFTLNRPLEFVYGMEPLIFLEDGPEHIILPIQKSFTNSYLDRAEFLIVGPNGQLKLNGIILDLGSMEDCKANIMKTFFKRKNSNLRKKIEFEDAYNTIQSKTMQWTEPGVSETFAKTVNAAKNKLNSEIAGNFQLGDAEVLQQKQKQFFINPDFLSPLEKRGQNSELDGLRHMRYTGELTDQAWFTEESEKIRARIDELEKNINTIETAIKD